MPPLKEKASPFSYGIEQEKGKDKLPYEKGLAFGVGGGAVSSLC